MRKGVRGRDPRRFLKMLSGSDLIPIEVVPLAVLPEKVLKSAVILPKDRRAKGVAKAKRVYARK
jgi:hypothetical protein